MLRLLVFFLIVAGFAAAAVWLSDQPGSLSLDWGGYEIRITLLGAVIVAVAGFALLYMAVRMIGIMMRAPANTARSMRIRRREKGLEALSGGLIAVSSGHVKLADKLSAKARKLMPREPLTLLLQAQAAQLKGDAKGAGQVYRAMLDSEQTQTLGLQGLFNEARRMGDNQVAMVIAERAAGIEPDSPWATPALMDLQAADGNWIAAGQSLERKKRYKLIDKAEARRQQAVLLTAQAMDVEDSQPERAQDMALKAHKLAIDLVPAAVIAGRLLSRKGRIAKAARVLEKTWKLSPHPDIADVYAHMKLGDKPQARLKRVRFLVHKNPDHIESALALAAAALSAQDWKLARSALELHLEAATRRVCALMAEIEDGEFGDKGRVRQWLSRALRAREDPMWIADGVAAPGWAPVSPVTGKLDAFAWTMPQASLPGPDEGEGEDDAQISAAPGGDETSGSIDAAPVALPHPDSAGREAGAKQSAAETGGSKAEPELIEAEPVQPAKKPAEQAGSGKGRKTAEKAQFTDQVDVALPQPDDPGPSGEDGGASSRLYS